ncbi:hypothetical protein CV770_34340 [Bradyrhizobium sp. AC87j1]|uniref:hypothetical protein n=1 Tax=Bradyrhizobium sp. AC87j1 TaxID=2055894 RepID=UPI000CEBC2CF|nr:hypothetical protein [Bradyrhizobium sp. AC87j1]PPQ14905.1 hypothetical protein CV770_34340 [Bradyrhizobium sp. AC87j1]
MKLRGIIALAFALSCAPAFGQSNQGASPLSIAKGGTAASTASAARASLGLTIGSAVQAWDADLDALAALSGTNTIYYRSGSNTWAGVTIGGMLSFVAGTLNVGDAELVALAGLTSAADKVPYFTGAGTAAVADFSSLARTLVGNTTNAQMRSTLGVVIGTDVQAFDADLSALAANSTAGFWAYTGAGTGAARTLTPPAAGFTITNPAGTAGNPTFVLANDLAALEGLSSTGLAARTTTDTWAQRSLVPPAAGFTITDAAGIAGNPTFALSNDLAALEGLASTGFAVRSAADTWAQRGLVAPAAGFTITNPGGIAGDPTFALANDLAAVEGLSCTGVAIRSATDTWLCRTIGGTANEITVANGDGVSGAPTISLPAALTFTGKTITGGTFAGPAISGFANFTGARRDSTQSTPAQITADQNDYNPSSVVCATSSTLIINSDAARNITGVAGGVAGCDLFLFNNGSFAITLKDGSTSSTAANRLDLGADFVLASKAAAHLKYDGNASRWRNTTGAGSGGGGSGTVTQVNTDGFTTTGGPITTSGTIAIADTYRRNGLIDRIYLSKALASYRRGLNTFADGFKASDGIDAGASSVYAVNSGFITPFSSYVTHSPSAVNTTFTHTGGGAAQAQLYDGNDTTPAADPAGLTSSTQAAFDLGSAKDITRVRVITAPSNGFGNTITFNIQYSDTSLTTGFTTASTIVVPAGVSQSVTQTFASAGAHRYWRIFYASGSASGNAWLGELSFQASSFGNMTLVTAAHTLDSSVSFGRVLLEYDASASPTLNTDLTAEVTCNGGTNWASATLSLVTTNGQGGRTVAETPDTSCIAGTSFAARIKTFNNKNIPIHGVSVTVH